MADAVRVLFVDDEESLRITMPHVLAKHGFEVTVADSVRNALAAMGRAKYDVLLIDLNLETPRDGLNVIAAMKARQPRCRNLILTAFPDFDSAQQAIRFNVADYFVKPVEIGALLKALRVVAENTLKLRAELNRTLSGTALADLELAFTFADVAKTSGSVETRNRNKANARTAFFVIRDQLLPRCSLDESQQIEIYGKLRELRSRLEELGERL